jgi:hypothetical protein
MTKRFKIILSVIFILALVVGARYSYSNNELEKEVINSITKKK